MHSEVSIWASVIKLEGKTDDIVKERKEKNGGREQQKQTPIVLAYILIKTQVLDYSVPFCKLTSMHVRHVSMETM